MAKKLSILDKTFQLALLLHRRTAEFNRKYKFTIGDRIDVVAEEAQEMILRANHQTDPKRAAQIIYDFVLRIDTLSLKLRMAVALGLMSDDAKAQCDMLIAKIKDEARGWRNYFAAERGLTMHPRKFYLQHYSKGIKFLGAVIKYNRVYTNNQTVARCFGKIHYYNEACRHSSRRKARHVEKLATILNSYLGLMRHFDTFNIRKRIAAEVGTVWCDYIRFDDDITTATVVKHFRQREICKYNVRKQRRRDLFTLKNLLNDGNTAAN